MKKKKLISFCLAALFAAGLMSSCGQDESPGQSEQEKNVRATTVKELTERLRAYNAGLGSVTRSGEASGPGTPVLNSAIKMNIVIADVKGGIRGAARGGLKGAIIGAALSSLYKAAWDNFFPSMVINPKMPTVFPAGSIFTLSDSIGYYHNVLEAKLYNDDNDSHRLPAGTLIEVADNAMRAMSASYAAGAALTTQQKNAIALDITACRQADTGNLSFDAYCDMLIQQNPADGDYIEFTAEYLYTVFYANVDVDEYTEEVLFMISNSNVGVNDVSLLNKCVQIAYASSIFSSNMNNN